MVAAPAPSTPQAKVFDLMAEEDYNKDATFILESFEGVSFAALSAQGRAIIGTPLVLNNHDVRQLRHSLLQHFSRFSAPHHRTRAAQQGKAQLMFKACPCLLDADWCLDPMTWPISIFRTSARPWRCSIGFSSPARCMASRYVDGPPLPTPSVSVFPLCRVRV